MAVGRLIRPRSAPKELSSHKDPSSRHTPPSTPGYDGGQRIVAYADACRGSPALRASQPLPPALARPCRRKLADGRSSSNDPFTTGIFVHYDLSSTWVGRGVLAPPMALHTSHPPCPGPAATCSPPLEILLPHERQSSKLNSCRLLLIV